MDCRSSNLNKYILLLCAVFAQLLLIVDGLTSNELNKPCTYFGGARKSSPEGNLVNCTWYASNSCCKRTEVTSVFGEMYPLHGASRECSNQMNYLMCYFCSPQQHQWYSSKASICASFCRDIYENCRSAYFQGRSIGEAYPGGQEFCRGQKFHVAESNIGCFQFDRTVFSHGSRLRSMIHAIFIVASYVQCFVL